MRSFQLFILMMSILLLQACGSSSGIKDDTTIISNDGDIQNSLNTLSINSQDIQAVLIKGVWKSIDINIASFYENNNLPRYKKKYKINMVFQDHKVVAYADCQKITAKYKIKDKTISFSNATIAPAIELPSCQQFEYADDALLAFVSNVFEVKEISEKKALLSAPDFDTDVLISR